MKKLILAIGTVLLLSSLLGCGTAAKEIQSRSLGEKLDVFTEISNESEIPKGFADLIINANIKTHIEGYYVLESKESLHGKPGYPFVINIDGQGIKWKVDGVKDIRPAYEADGKTSRDPEAGEGLKYVLEKKIRLHAGTHKVFLGFPEENFFAEGEVTLTEGGENILEFKPVYRYKTHPTRIPTFLKGIKEYEVYLNGNKIR
ncbi:MAG: hypothetical protein M1508_13375 [Nitrospirae bacterium]|nr:hypothetical protein [Nitrospirota bacterium]MCL5421664.1 hypothetical protein [Nitrospirota bacterium]